MNSYEHLFEKKKKNVDFEQHLLNEYNSAQTVVINSNRNSNLFRR